MRSFVNNYRHGVAGGVGVGAVVVLAMVLVLLWLLLLNRMTCSRQVLFVSAAST
jgi:hypothetical protein